MRRTLRFLSVTRLGTAFAAAAVAYFAFVVPNDLAILLVGSAVGFAAAAYAPLFGVLLVARLLG